MMRFLAALLILLLAAGAGFLIWGRHSGPIPAPAAAANQDSRALSAAEQAQFLPLACGGASAGSDGYAHDCASLPGYPSADYGGAGLGLGITLTSVTYGHFTDASADEAYISYQGSFESHADNFGGGFLLRADGKGGWTLRRWVPGQSMDGCLALNPQGQSKMLCLRGSTGQGETDTIAAILTPGETGQTVILAASDLRETMDENANCGLRNASQDVLLGIDSLARPGADFSATVELVPAAVANTACAAKNFANAPVTKQILTLHWDGHAMSISPALHVAPAA